MRAGLAVLRHCSHAGGLKASARAYGHQQVWVRDSMIALLGGSLADDPVIRSALLASLSSFRRHQTPAGLIPNHIDLEARRPNFRAYADGGLWYAIGSSLCAPDFGSIRKVLAWYECQDVDRSGLISIQEASDWQDLFCTRGKGLYVNCLRVIALRQAAQLAEREGKPAAAARYRAQADTASAAINGTLWYAGDGEMLRHVAHSFRHPIRGRIRSGGGAGCRRNAFWWTPNTTCLTPVSARWASRSTASATCWPFWRGWQTKARAGASWISWHGTAWRSTR